jgi:hypothetical protein
MFVGAMGDGGREMNPMRVQCFGVLAVLLFASAALGDGCYIPELAVRKIPEIPAQRAVLSWKDGMETLVISSTLDSDAQKLGWIIPVPAVPKIIEKVSPGALKTLNFCIQPKITHDLSPGITLAVFVAVVANLLVGTLLFDRKRFLTVLIALFLVLLFWSLLLPALGTTGAAKAANVRVEKSATVGSYDVSVLRPSRSDGLNVWLAENGFSPLPTAADKTIADYISKGWVFAAIKLTRAESGMNAPHPIKMVFAAQEAVYPMKLTAVAGGSPEFELFLIGDGSASCDMLEREFSDIFSKREHDASDVGEGVTYEAQTSFVGTTTRMEIGHAGITSLIWDSCVLTKFAGTINSNNMTRDLQFAWSPFEACQQHFFTTSGARSLALLFFVLLTGGWCFVSMIVCRKRIVQSRGFRWYLGRVLAPAIVLFALGAGIVFVSVPKLSASEVWLSRSHYSWGDFFPSDLQRSIEMLLKDHPDIVQGTDQEIGAWLLKTLDETRVDKAKPRRTITGTELKAEDSPGNFTVEKRDDKIVIRVYDRVGMVRRAEYPIPDQSGKSTKTTVGGAM